MGRAIAESSPVNFDLKAGRNYGCDNPFRYLKTVIYRYRIRSKGKKIRSAISVEPKNDFKDWTVRDDQIFPYDESFAEVLEGKTFDDLLAESKKQKGSEGKIFALDFMGYGQVLRSINIDGGLAVALGDPRSREGKWLDKKKGVDFVEGNILRRKTWQDMQEWLDLQETDDKKFDLILCRAVGGIDDLVKVKGIHFLLLQRLWSMLSSNNGTLLTQFNSDLFFKYKARKWINVLNQTEGVEAKYSYKKPKSCDSLAFRPVLYLVKTEGAPDKLPIL